MNTETQNTTIITKLHYTGQELITVSRVNQLFFVFELQHTGLQERYVWTEICVDFELCSNSGQLVESAESSRGLCSGGSAERPE